MLDLTQRQLIDIWCKLEDCRIGASCAQYLKQIDSTAVPLISTIWTANTTKILTSDLVPDTVTKHYRDRAIMAGRNLALIVDLYEQIRDVQVFVADEQNGAFNDFESWHKVLRSVCYVKVATVHRKSPTLD